MALSSHFGHGRDDMRRRWPLFFFPSDAFSWACVPFGMGEGGEVVHRRSYRGGLLLSIPFDSLLAERRDATAMHPSDGGTAFDAVCPAFQ